MECVRIAKLLRANEMAAAVLLPAGLAVVVAELLFLAEADGAQAIGGNAQRDEILLDGAGAAVAEREGVFSRGALVAMALDGDAHLGIIAQEVSRLGEGFAGIGANVTLIEIEVGVAHFLGEELVDGRLRRFLGRRGWGRDSYAGSGRGGAAGT